MFKIKNFNFFQKNYNFSFLKRLAMKPKQYFEIDSMINVENIDHVPIKIKIKYLVSLIKNNFQFNIDARLVNDKSL